MLTPNETSGNIISLPRPGEGFIAETAIKLDRLQAMVSSLEVDTRDSKRVLSDLTDTADRARRMQAFEESLRNAREYKIDEMLRCCRDMKARLDHIEGKRATYMALPHNTFEQINSKLAELSSMKQALEASERRVRINGLLFLGALALLLALPLYEKLI